MDNNFTINDNLIVKYLLHETGSQETTAVEQWINESPDNQNYFNELKDIWEHAYTLKTTVTINEQASWESLKAKLAAKKPKALFSWTKAMSVAAASLLLLVTSWYFIFKNKPELPALTQHNTNENSPFTKPPKINQLLAQTNVRIDTLSDKSVVTLNRRAELDVPEQFVDNERRVALKGEAFFKISPNKQKPFFIETPADVEIKVLGTSFNVKAYKDYTEVLVEEGTVELRRKNQVLLLRMNDKARIYKNSDKVKVEKNKDKLYKYYRSRVFECDNTPLWKVVEVLNEAYDNCVVIDNAELKKLTISTTFNNEPIEQVMEVLSETFEFKVEKKNKMYYIK